MITEYRVCYKSWRRGPQGEKVDFVGTIEASSREDAESSAEILKRKKPWIETRKVTKWERQP